MVKEWKQSSYRVGRHRVITEWSVTEWSQSGHRVVTEWSQSGHRVVTEWLESGHRVVNEWSNSGYVHSEQTLCIYCMATQLTTSGHSCLIVGDDTTT